MSLPGVFSAVVDGFVGWLVSRGGVSSVGLFGGWTRYEGAGGELDVLVVGSPGVDYEYSEMVEYRGRVFDLNFVPRRLVGDVVNPDMDHRLHEVEVYHDSGGVLGRAKGFVEGCYRTRGRVEVRTEGYLQGADMYMSRAASALTRGDFESSVVYGEAALTPVAHLLLDVAGYPVTHGDLVWSLRRACERLRLVDIFSEVLDIVRLGNASTSGVKGLLGVYGGVWDAAAGRIRGGSGFMVGVPGRMRRDVEYLTSALLRRVVDERVGALLEGGNAVGAVFSLRGWLLPLLEAYAWFVAGGRGDKFDYTSLFRELSRVREVHGGAREVFGLGNIGRGEARVLLGRVRDLIGRVRGARRALIEGYVG